MKLVFLCISVAVAYSPYNEMIVCEKLFPITLENTFCLKYVETLYNFENLSVRLYNI